MRVIIAVAGLAIVGVSACAPRPAVVPASPSPPLPVAGRDWFVHADGESAMLAYGVEASDELSLRFDCRPGSGRTDILQPAARTAAEIRLESGGVAGAWRASAEPGNIEDEVLLLAEAPVTAPVFAQFRNLGWLAIDYGGERRGLAAQPGSADRVERYFKLCE